ncbi:MAG: hypothetical protein IJ113_09330 [Eggerthellaceae bacterium]|nr:hypothetical protein [Eggerthellaceae bacterium]
MQEKIKNAKSTLKVLGILSIILGVFGIILGAMSFAGGGLLAGQMASTAASGGMSADAADTAAGATGLMLVGGILILVSGIFTLLLGIFSVRGANDFSKIGAAYALALINLVLSVISVFVTIFISGMNISAILDAAVGIVFSAVIFWAAKTIKDNA